MATDFISIDLVALRSYVNSEEGDVKIAEFVQNLRSKAGNRESYESTLAIAEKDFEQFSVVDFEALIDRFTVFMRNMPPGHDAGHLYRDFMASVALSPDAMKIAKYKADVLAGVLAGTFHDIGNAIVHRYADRERRCGHGEVGAWLFWKFSADIVPESLRCLTAYSIAAHTHYTKPIEIKNVPGFSRDVFWAELWGEEGNLIGLAAKVIARGADRLDTNGITLILRDFWAKADPIEEGIQGAVDVAGGSQETTFEDINLEGLIAKWVPVVHEERQKNPSILDHAKMYAGSNFGASVFSADDSNIPTLDRLMHFKVDQMNKLISLVQSVSPYLGTFDAEHAKGLFKALSRQISHADAWEIDRVWATLKKSWDVQPDEVKAKWNIAFQFMLTAHVDWLIQLRDSATENSDEELKRLINEIYERCL